MDTATQDLYTQKIEEFVLDEDKIITCSMLANDMKISLQDSKLLLRQFVADQRQKNPHELSVTYILNGTLKDSNLPCICLAKEHELKEKRSQFDKVTSEVLYSVQKKNNIDFNIIALVEKIDSDKSRESCLIGSVVSKNCIKRILKRKKLPSPQKPVAKQKPSFFTKMEPKNENVDTKATSSKEVPNKPKQEPKGKSKGGIANFFTKGAQKPAENKPKASDSVDNVKTDETQKVVNGIKSEITSESIEENKNSKTEKLEEPEEKMEVDEDSDIERAPVSKKTANTSAKKNNKKRPNKQNGEQPAKKRKRIVQRNDSDSDDIFGGEEDNYDEVVEKSFVEEAEHPPKVQKPLAPRNKVKKAVDRTYEDEDGFIVTRTEYVYETPSEDEAEEIKLPEKTTPKPVSKPAEVEKKSSSPSENESPKNTKGSRGKKGKKAPPTNQPSIMNFFKKK